MAKQMEVYPRYAMLEFINGFSAYNTEFCKNIAFKVTMRVSSIRTASSISTTNRNFAFTISRFLTGRMMEYWISWVSLAVWNDTEKPMLRINVTTKMG